MSLRKICAAVGLIGTDADVATAVYEQIGQLTPHDLEYLSGLTDEERLARLVGTYGSDAARVASIVYREYKEQA